MLIHLNGIVKNVEKKIKKINKKTRYLATELLVSCVNE